MNNATQSIDGHCLISGLDNGDTATVRLAVGFGLADLAVEASDCGQYLMLMCGETLVALVGAMGSDVEAVEFADGGRYRVEDLMEMVRA
ncbi:MAG: hypothetical protein HZA62_00390 [Rhodocyclales bacterium]|nr:hypothetical protein [Rhodocyclales bacterium]